MSEERETEHGTPTLRRDPTTTTVAWAAAIIASIALAGGIYLEKEREKLKDRIADVRLELRDAERALSGRDAGFASQDALDRLEGDAARRMLELERHYDQLQAGFEHLRDQSEGGRGAWARAELEYVIRLAMQHLEIERDPTAALLAMRSVERRLREYGEPLYGPVIARIERDIAALEAVAVPDLEGVVLTLDAIGNRIDGLPIAQPEGLEAPGAGRADEPGFAGVDWSAMWRRVRDTFRSMITIRREGRPELVLLTPREETFVHLNAQLKLEGIRVAALRRDPQAYSSSLRNSRAWIRSWYDTTDPTVEAILGELDALDDVDLDPSLPDISGSLRMLRAANQRRGD